ncbi:hypothetical protein BaRGS_00003164 [Batillaria attramentaria]|uniref:Uncharacterized protein n=1 Tax=Batillaria attramentaria TaxID=370345 RepID=A0ABD0M266_9CAEN
MSGPPMYNVCWNCQIWKIKKTKTKNKHTKKQPEKQKNCPQYSQTPCPEAVSLRCPSGDKGTATATGRIPPSVPSTRGECREAAILAVNTTPPVLPYKPLSSIPFHSNEPRQPRLTGCGGSC